MLFWDILWIHKYYKYLLIMIQIMICTLWESKSINIGGSIIQSVEPVSVLPLIFQYNWVALCGTVSIYGTVALLKLFLFFILLLTFWLLHFCITTHCYYFFIWNSHWKIFSFGVSGTHLIFFMVVWIFRKSS
jgi:hypothetical protein